MRRWDGDSARLAAASTRRVTGGGRMTDDRRDNPLPASCPATRTIVPSFRLPLSAFRLCFRALASLQLAVVLIAVYAVVLAGATFVESKLRRRGSPIRRLRHRLVRRDPRPAGRQRALRHAHSLSLATTADRVSDDARRHPRPAARLRVTRWAGIEAQLSVYEGHASHLAYEGSLHFELDVHRSDKAENRGREGLVRGRACHGSLRAGPVQLERRPHVVVVSLVSGASKRGDRVRQRRHHARRARLHQGAESGHARPADVDGKTEEFDLAASSAETVPKGQRRIVGQQRASRGDFVAAGHGGSRFPGLSAASFGASSIPAAECRRTIRAWSIFSTGATRRRSCRERSCKRTC